MNNKQRMIIDPPKTTSLFNVINHDGQDESIYLVAEHPLTIHLNKKEIVTVMTMGTHPDYLVAGFLINQQLIKNADDIISIHIDWSVNSASVYTKEQIEKPLGKRIVTTGCGQGTMFENIINKLDIKLDILPNAISKKDIYHLLESVSSKNEIYRQAGGVHSCGICAKDRVIMSIEDVGRHNAIDSLTGYIGLESIAEKPLVMYTTGRLTSEMVIKTAQMKIPILLSRSGATAMGIDIAQKAGITTIARAKGKRFLVLTHPERISL